METNSPQWLDSPFAERVRADMRDSLDLELRQPDKVYAWRDMLVALLQDSNGQISQHRAELAYAESRYVNAIDGPDEERELKELGEERARQADWKRRAITYHRAIQRRLAEANAIIRQMEREQCP